ncbi:unnamed protein product (macronuclear) [Paramecium tetraurelia]|uniref:Rhomboid-like protease n=1 Tax=Paramecium tetraurelia TaxID=5888 RepID=A0DQH8_PARTE|nr:uncharacterized protein GSPATT00002695001 [Paramecium tetraurelia]CAK85295.1 unnamed protein product [Paramecium tetraurelia]|eukprot:XP_001452692.1 hypothetical protein (macronuclear) [Paramecium tetraurelia strain d4-2]
MISKIIIRTWGGNGRQQMISIFGGMDADPRGENFFDMLKKSFCPRLKLISFTTIVSALIIILYITMLGVGGINKHDRFLSVYEKTLNDFGGNDPDDVKSNYEIFRWVTSLLLVGDFYNLILAIFMILICYSILEATQGLNLTLIVFFGAGACGALFGDLCNICKYRTYSETFSCIYACVGFLIGYIILYWKKLDSLGEMKCAVVCFVAIVVIFVMIFTFGSGQNNFYDNFGELGGFLGGLFIAMSLVQVPQSGEFEGICRKVGYGFLGVQVGLSIILLYSLSCS